MGRRGVASGAWGVDGAGCGAGAGLGARVTAADGAAAASSSIAHRKLCDGLPEFFVSILSQDGIILSLLISPVGIAVGDRL